MLNLLGDVWFDANMHMRLPNWAAVLALPGTHLHLYGKTEARKARKMGHLNVTGASSAQVREVALKAATLLGIEAF
jgi:5-(carboxyamino)imidazole ribonucleotide synthase